MTIINFQCPGVTRITIPTRISHLVAAWAGQWQWASLTISGCMADNQEALFYIWPFPPPTTTTTTITTINTATTTTINTTTTAESELLNTAISGRPFLALVFSGLTIVYFFQDACLEIHLRSKMLVKD